MANEVQRYKDEFQVSYEEHNPDKIAEVDAILGKHESSEKKVYLNACSKYGAPRVRLGAKRGAIGRLWAGSGSQADSAQLDAT